MLLNLILTKLITNDCNNSETLKSNNQKTANARKTHRSFVLNWKKERQDICASVRSFFYISKQATTTFSMIND